MVDDESGSVADSILVSDDHIFQNKQLLNIGHVPESDRIVGRDEEIKDLAKRLRDSVDGGSPENVLIYGKTGTGKSLVSNHVTQRIQKITDEYRVGVCYVDCSEDTTETQAVTTMCRSLNDQNKTGFHVPASGFGASRYYKFLWQILNELYDVVIVILDEVDLLQSDDVLMKLSRAEESQKINTSLGLIAISNKLGYPERLNERTKSTLQQHDLFFSPYDANQLREILQNRRDAFKKDILTDDVIPLCAAFAGQEHGDARKAIDTLRLAGEYAYEQGSDTVTEEHVRTAQEIAEKERFRELVENAPTQEKFILLALAELTLQGNGDKFKTSLVYKTYEQICNEISADPLSKRRIREILSQQAFLGILEIEKVSEGKRGGVYRNNQLLEDPKTVREIILEDSRLEEWNPK